jgi:hypothetical protein
MPDTITPGELEALKGVHSRFGALCRCGRVWADCLIQKLIAAYEEAITDRDRYRQLLEVEGKHNAVYSWFTEWKGGYVPHASYGRLASWQDDSSVLGSVVYSSLMKSGSVA